MAMGWTAVSSALVRQTDAVGVCLRAHYIAVLSLELDILMHYGVICDNFRTLNMIR